MVLHNDKWAKKAKRAVERRKGGGGRGRGIHHAPETSLDHLDMNRDVTEDQPVPIDLQNSPTSEDSFEFDSADEGNGVIEKRDTTIAQSNKAITKHETVSQTSTRHQESNLVTEAQAEISLPIEKKFARRRLVDNSSRYEEPFLDPYLHQEEPEEQPDYKLLAAKPFKNPKEVELVPDGKTSRKTVLSMQDTSHFDRMKQIQQKEEYARDMRLRFGHRQVSGRKVSDDEINDEDFFTDIASKSQKSEIHSLSRPSNRVPEVGTADDHQKLERYLDDLLKL